ncbi:OmpP1/FadL family transporter [Acinetobacter sp. CAAS 2-6]|uniref:OmpP1/FadL family transporter n=1 Tax=Acinetobacter sp. CAAS 2-6 TaxID=3016358 RepID=UPI002DD62AAF|nr:outer membrane protein transport protein [Acinetobacter sp. CAAS 2-6]
MKRLVPLLSAAVIAPLFSSSAFATTGYFMHAYSVKSQGNAGTSIANFQDSLTIASNPAGLSWVGSRLDAGVTLFAPDREAEIVGNTGIGFGSANGQYDGNSRKYFLIPEFGYSHPINDQLAAGIAVYGNGGMNTNYKNNPYAAFGNTGSAGINLNQLFVSPAISWEYAENQSLALAANILYQRFQAKGFDGFVFGSVSNDSTKLSNGSHDDSTGVGARIGWSAKVNDQLTLGATYASKIDASRFKKYAGLFAEQGDFDVPENYGVGLNYQVTPALSVAADYQRINYSDVKSVGNDFNAALVMSGNPELKFGGQNGPGFGWDDINVYKVSATYQASPKLTLRAGYSYNDQPVREDQTFLNILAPGVVQQHLSLGATWNIDQKQEVSVAYTHALEETVNGSNSIPGDFGGGEANLTMDQNILGVSYGVKF